MSEEMARLTTTLYDHGCVKLGMFALKSGLKSPIYIDLRLLVSHPRLLKQVAATLAGAARGLTFDRIAAIPYAALPIGVAMALEMDRPMIYPRREIKGHGTRRAVEGAYEAGETALLVDDLITRGHSKLDAVGLLVHDVLVLIDREQGGAQDLAERGYQLHAVLELTAMLAALQDTARITPKEHADVLAYLEQTRAN
jgi:uridine monophosphate synthetase